MPFDFLPPAEQTPDVKSLPRTLEGLAYLLRHRELWPESFEWNYSECPTCAMGLASKMFGMALADAAYENVENASRFFKIPHDQARDFFINAGDGRESCLHLTDVTPEDVANAIDQYLANRTNAG